MSIDPVSHALGGLQAAMENLRAQHEHEIATARDRHTRVMEGLEDLRARMASVEVVVEAHKSQLEAAGDLVTKVNSLKAHGTGALLVLASLWAAVAGAAAWFKVEILRWLSS